ncbi:MAG: S-layer homology domain-containing protein [Oscillospiraceae bacterium]|jgi:hypothetical protein|nr:S-layer homology domain-containing protein [Oscillospiraceae bacterium]
MKRLSRKILSLLLVMAMVCAMAPAAMAVDGLSFTLNRDTYSDSVSIPYNSSATFSTTYTLRDYYGNYYDYSGQAQVSYSWTLSDRSGRSWSVGSNTSSCTVYSSDLRYYDYDYNYDYYYYSYTLRCDATAYYDGVTYTDSTSWTINGDGYGDNNYYGSISVSATVYDTTSGYGLGETDDAGGRSIISQIENALPSGYYLRYLTFHNTTSSNGSLNASTSVSYYNDYDGYYGSNYNALSNVTFTPSSYSGSASFNFTAYVSYYNYNTSGYDRTYSGTMTFKIEEGTTGNAVVYSAKSGDTVYFDASDFQNYWNEIYSRGSLSYVRFTSLSSGSLYGDHSGARRISVGSASSATSCYVSPTSTQIGLDEVAYVPSGSSKSITIRFTAYGSSNSSSGSSTSRSGVVTILYVDSTATPIVYNATGNSISLNGGDFTDKYYSVVGSSASNVTIKLRSVPSNGALSYQSRALTSSNINSYTFSSSDRGSNRISDITYTPGRAGTTDTVEYACYNGGTLRFIGTITFNATPAVASNLVINYTSGSSGVTFSSMDFFASSSAMAASSYLTFGTPSSGGLYVNNAPVSSGTQFAFYTTGGSGYQNLNNLTYKPAAGFSGTATIAFTAYNINNTMAANGTVQIAVSQPANPSTPSSGIFKDTPSNAWYASAVSSLVQAGVIAGYDDGTFRPNNAVTYGEALKMIMRAAGYPAQQEGTGANWAINYKNTAVADGLVDESIVLSNPINRNAVAAIAAKALHLSPVSGASPFADTSDGYVLALYQAGIVQGDSSSGTAYYNGSDTLNRAQISAIIYRINNYRTPVNNTPDTDMPGWLLN